MLFGVKVLGTELGRRDWHIVQAVFTLSLLCNNGKTEVLPEMVCSVLSLSPCFNLDIFACESNLTECIIYALSVFLACYFV